MSGCIQRQRRPHTGIPGRDRAGRDRRVALRERAARPRRDGHLLVHRLARLDFLVLPALGRRFAVGVAPGIVQPKPGRHRRMIGDARPVLPVQRQIDARLAMCGRQAQVERLPGLALRAGVRRARQIVQRVGGQRAPQTAAGVYRARRGRPLLSVRNASVANSVTLAETVSTSRRPYQLATLAQFASHSA
jgi:hypothetical protein